MESKITLTLDKKQYEILVRGFATGIMAMNLDATPSQKDIEIIMNVENELYRYSHEFGLSDLTHYDKTLKQHMISQKTEREILKVMESLTGSDLL